MKYRGLKTPPKSKAEILIWMAPLVATLDSKGGQARPREVYEELANIFKLSAEERERTNKREVVRYENKIAWARSYLVKTGYWTCLKKVDSTFEINQRCPWKRCFPPSGLYPRRGPEGRRRAKAYLGGLNDTQNQHRRVPR
ncbi:MAG: winged helix-turn-helix domain-containing protein [Magnetovibrio sp.]|nr:winged helix-turn-helix domain-containing protein [Magnetovibrio sp.]